MNLQDAAGLFRFSVHPLELVLRGSAVYAFLFVLFRFVLRRDAGSIGIADILLLVLIADASQNAMAGDYKTVADGCLLVATLAGWDWLIDWAGFRFKAVRRLVEPAPVVLVRHGRLQRHAMRRQLITESELMARLRHDGIEKLAQVKLARLEGDGDISVIRDEGESASSSSSDGDGSSPERQSGPRPG